MVGPLGSNRAPLLGSHSDILLYFLVFSLESFWHVKLLQVLFKGTFVNLLVKVKSINFKGSSLKLLNAYRLIPYRSHQGQTG